MQATEILMAEHRVIERVIDSIECATEKLEAGQPVRPGFFLDAAEFVRGFADGCHHKKEEGVLFEALVAEGLPRDVGPIGMMLSEHELGRDFTRGMRDAATRLQAGDDTARSEIARNAVGYARLLRGHIQKEDTVLFPLADRMISGPERDAILDGFEHVEHEETGEGVHEKYLALAERLEREAQG